MKTLLSLILITLLTSSCVQYKNCKAKPDPKITIEEKETKIDHGANVTCSF
jgi:PBP1b-binding outer membrane lipoprotein LpoB